MQKFNMTQKIFLGVVALLIASLMVGCKESSKEPQIITDAKVALNYYVTHYASNPTEFKVIGLDTLVTNDSLCILDIHYITENEKGGHTNAKGQYIYLTYKGKKHSFFVDGINDRYDATKMYLDTLLLTDLKCKSLCAPIRFGRTLEDLNDVAILVGAEDLEAKYFKNRTNLTHRDSLYYNACILTELYSSDVPQIEKVDLANIKPIEVVDMSKK